MDYCIMEFDRSTRKFTFLRMLKLAGSPHNGDKIVMDIDEIGYIFSVHDVHFADNCRTDVNVIRIGKLTDYYKTNGPQN